MGNDALYGGEGDDVLYGGQGHDELYGGLGNDTLDGGLGNDVLTGGAGADVFVFTAGWDRITDFSVLEDLIDMSGFSQANSFEDILAAAQQREEGVFLRFTGNGLMLEHIQLDQLESGHFIW